MSTEPLTTASARDYERISINIPRGALLTRLKREADATGASVSSSRDHQLRWRLTADNERLSNSPLRAELGLTEDKCKTVRVEGAPIPLRPRKKWDNGKDVVLAGDAAGVVAPASGEGIYYAMEGGRLAAEAVEATLATGKAKALTQARKRFMKAHGKVFMVLGIMQHFWYRSDKRRERFVSLCDDPDIQELTWQAYMNKELVRAKPAAHARIFLKDMGHLLGLRPA
jgi:geranylgeranyl reductase